MKKFLILLLACVMVLPLSACGGSDKNDETTDKITETDQNKTDDQAGNDVTDDDTADTDTDTDNADDKDTAANTETKTDGGNTVTGIVSKDDLGEPSIDETVVLDNEHAFVKITGVKVEDDEFSVDVYMENRSKDKKYSFFVWTASVNGIQIDPMYGDDVDAASSKTVSIPMSSSYLDACGVDAYTDVTMTFVVYDVENVEDDFLAKGTGQFFPYGKDAAQDVKVQLDDSDTILMDQGGIQVACIDEGNNPYAGYYAMLYVTNNSNDNITIASDSSKLDGVEASIFTYLEVEKGNTGFVEVYWDGSGTIEYDDQGNPIESDEPAADPSKAKEILIDLAVYLTDTDDDSFIFHDEVKLK